MLRLFEGREPDTVKLDNLAPWVHADEASQIEAAAAIPLSSPLEKPEKPARVVAFCSAIGSVGKTTMAINVAFELATAGHKVAVLDFDICAPSLLTSLNQEAITAGLSGAHRLVGQGRFFASDLNRFMMVLNFDGVRVSVLPGLGVPFELGASAGDLAPTVRRIIETSDADYVVLDLPNISSAPEVAAAALSMADLSFSICTADPIGVQRQLWLQNQLKHLGLPNEPQLIVNRVRDSVLGANAKRQLADTFERISKTEVVAFVPDDPPVFDIALREGLPLRLAKKASPARHAISMFVRQGILGQRSQLDWRVARNG